MTCQELEADLIEYARGVRLEAGRAGDIDRHALDCARCTSVLEQERALSAALRRMARETCVPDPDPATDRALMAAFDGASARGVGGSTVDRSVSSSRLGRSWMPAAAGVLLILGTSLAAWRSAGSHPSGAVTTRDTVPPGAPAATAPARSGSAAAAARGPGSPRQPVARVASATVRKPRGAAQRPAEQVTEFVPWPGARGLPTFESGALMRVDLPVSVLPSLGLTPPYSSAVSVRADVLVGQDGRARAVRLVP